MIAGSSPLPGIDLSQVESESGPYTKEAIRRLANLVAQPVGWDRVLSRPAGPWVAYDANWSNTGSSNPSLGNGAQASAWSRLGTTIRGYIAYNIGSTTTLGDAAGVWTFDLPTAPGVSAAFVFAYWIPNASGTPRYFSTTIPLVNSRAISLYTDNGTAWSPSVPVAATNGDKLRIYFEYREV